MGQIVRRNARSVVAGIVCCLAGGLLFLFTTPSIAQDAGPPPPDAEPPPEDAEPPPEDAEPPPPDAELPLSGNEAGDTSNATIDANMPAGTTACMVYLTNNNVSASDMCEDFTWASATMPRGIALVHLKDPASGDAIPVSHSAGGNYHGVRCNDSGTNCADHSGNGRGNSQCALADVCAPGGHSDFGNYDACITACECGSTECDDHCTVCFQ